MNQRRNILGNGSSFQVQEAYKTLRTNIRFSSAGRKFCVTSGLASEGKSITALNIAISFAEAGQRVLLIDADLRRPSQARLLIENGAPGLSNVLAGLCDDENAIRKDLMKNLDVMFSGDTLFAGTIGRTDFPGSDHQQMMASLKRLAKEPGDYRVLPGHAEETTLNEERRSNPFL